MAEELACKELVELVTDYLDGALPAGDRLRFEQHLLDCPGCEAYLAQMRETIRLAGSLREEDLDPEARDRLLEVFRAWKQRGGTHGSPTNPLLPRQTRVPRCGSAGQSPPPPGEKSAEP